MISQMLNNISNGSSQATPSLGSATIDYATTLPATLIKWIGGFVATLGL